VGVSKDSVEAQEKFSRKHGLTFPLLADESGEVIKRYGVDVPLLGLAKRKTFLIDSKGRIARIYEQVIPSSHAAEVLADLESVA